jgi:hypothetical protein
MKRHIRSLTIYYISEAIIRYFAKKNGLYGKNDEEEYKCDMIAAGTMVRSITFEIRNANFFCRIGDVLMCNLYTPMSSYVLLSSTRSGSNLSTIRTRTSIFMSLKRWRSGSPTLKNYLARLITARTTSVAESCCSATSWSSICSS